MQTVSVGALVTSLTNSAMWGGLLGGTMFMASGLLAPFGGVVADRHNRRRLLVGLSLVQAVVATVLAVLYAADLVSPALLLAFVLIEGLLLAFVIPAHNALVPDIVGGERIATAAALGQVSWNLGRCLGPALAGVLIVIGSYTLIFALNALTFLVVVVSVAFIRAESSHQRSSATFVQRLMEGFRGARSDDGCWTTIRFVALTGVFVSPFIALMPAMAQIALDGTPADTAHLVMAQGLGSVFGAFCFARLIKTSEPSKVMTGLFLLLPLVEMSYALSPTKWFAIGGAFALGGAYIAISVGSFVIIQLRAPSHLRARVLSLNYMTLAVTYPIGAVVQGSLSDIFGLREVLFVAPAIYLVLLGVIAVMDASRFRSLGPATVAT